MNGTEQKEPSMSNYRGGKRVSPQGQGHSLNGGTDNRRVGRMGNRDGIQVNDGQPGQEVDESELVCPHGSCDGTGWIEDWDTGHRHECLCRLELEGDQQYDLEKDN